MSGFVVFTAGVLSAFVLFTAPGINIWFGVGFWLAAASVVLMVAGISMMLSQSAQRSKT